MFELLPRDNRLGNARALNKKRMLIGSAEACDIILPYPGISPIHAVLEITENGAKIYDMNSPEGVFVNGKKSIISDLKVGDTLKIANSEFVFKNFESKEAMPPVLDVLGKDDLVGDSWFDEKKVPLSGGKLPSSTPVPPPVSKGQRANEQAKRQIIKPIYPLEKDPKADFTEYIFEDSDDIRPVFSYTKYQDAAEVIFLYKDKILEVDYLPAVKGTYYIVGKPNPADMEVSFAAVPKKDKLPFIEIGSGDVTIHKFDSSYQAYVFGDKRDSASPVQSPSFILLEGDIVRFVKDDIQIFIRKTPAPPKTLTPPFFKQDKELKKYLVLMILLGFLISAVVITVGKNPNLEKEKAPERIVKILKYTKPPEPKKELVVAKTEAVAKTEDAPKEVVQKSPQKPVETPKEVKKADLAVAKKPDPAPPKKVPPAPAKVKQDAPKVTGKAGPVKPAVKPAPAKPAPAPAKRPGPAPGPVTKQAAKPAPTQAAPSKGHVETYKSPDFTGSLSSLVAKGGSATKTATQAASAGASGDGGIQGAGAATVSSGGATTVEQARVSTEVGSFSGSTTGKLDSNQGMKGLVNKSGVSLVGVPSAIEVVGGMDPDIIRRILLDHLPQFRACYQSVLDTSSNAIDGGIQLDFTIGASGSVSAAGASNTKGNLPANVRGCVITVLKGIKFPAPSGGGTVSVRQPMNFQPKGG